MTRTTQIIIVALVMGVGWYLAFVVWMNQVPPQAGGNLPFLGIPLAAGGVVAAMVLNGILAGQQRRRAAEAAHGDGDDDAQSRHDATTLLQGFQTRRIIQGALFEGPAFFNVFAYQQAGEPFSLMIACGLLVALAMLFPLQGRVENWLESELRLVRDLRSMRRM